jgi:translin
MINRKFFWKLKENHRKALNERMQIINISNDALHNAKRIIFILHRGETNEAKKKLFELERILRQLEKKFGHDRISEEGSYMAAVEEYVEAKMFYFVMINKKIDRIKEINLNYSSYLAGLCDLTGELVRRAVNEAAAGNLSEVTKIKKIINEIMAELIEFDMFGYLRTKYDQAKHNLGKIEQIDYENSRS